jgi:hypothetical protein
MNTRGCDWMCFESSGFSRMSTETSKPYGWIDDFVTSGTSNSHPLDHLPLV